MWKGDAGTGFSRASVSIMAALAVLSDNDVDGISASNGKN